MRDRPGCSFSLPTQGGGRRILTGGALLREGFGMYLPAAFAQTDRTRLHDFIEAHSFGLLVSASGGEPFASHLPFLLERDAGPHGTLVGHLARANPQWHGL